MLNYYEILGIAKSADHETIRSSFKKLALKYHPDKNPGNTAAEEYFKLVNEAYQILSDPDKKRRYDFLLNYKQAKSSNYTFTKRPATRTPQKGEKSVYDRYGKYSWKTAPKYKKAPSYRVDKNYYKIQVITLVAMVLLAVVIMAMNQFWNYIENQKRLEIQKQNELALLKAHQLFENGEYRNAIKEVITLERKNPFESVFYEEKEDMVSSLWLNAQEQFNNKLYKDAADKLEIVKDYERPMKIKTWNMLADAYFELKDYKKSAIALDKILQRDKYNIRLVVRIARLYQYNLDNNIKALEYYDEAKLLFKEFQSSTYGDAFELIVQPDKLPDFYHTLFVERARLNMKEENYQEAMTDCNWAIFLRPSISETYNMRAHCKRNLGLNYRACKDWERAIARGHTKSHEDLNKYCQSL